MTDSGDSRTSRIASGYRVMRTILGGTKACLQPKWNSNESNSLTRHVENSFRVPSTYRTLASEGEIPRTQWANKYYSLTNACFCRKHSLASRVAPGCTDERKIFAVYPYKNSRNRKKITTKIGRINNNLLFDFFRLLRLFLSRLIWILQVFPLFLLRWEVIRNCDLFAQTYFFLYTRRIIACILIFSYSLKNYSESCAISTLLFVILILRNVSWPNINEFCSICIPRRSITIVHCPSSIFQTDGPSRKTYIQFFSYTLL